MAEFALLINGEKKELRFYPEKPEDIPHKSVVWLPVLREYGEPFEGVESGSYVIRIVNPATLPPPVPKTVSPRQIRLALLARGKLEDANSLAATLDQAHQVSWEFATAAVRDDPNIIQFGHALGFTDSDLDDIFRQAASL